MNKRYSIWTGGAVVVAIFIIGVLFYLEMFNRKIPVIFDTDANNELDDQHALAYLLFNGDTFDVKGVTVNTTRNGGNIDEQFAEADRVVKLCDLDGRMPIFKGADGDFESISDTVESEDFDGKEAVDFIINQAHKWRSQKLVVLAVGKLTNVALALEKDPSIAGKIRLVWLGSNYPDKGEYNLINDIPSMNYILGTDVEMEMVTVRYGKPDGTAAVLMTKSEAQTVMPGLGPRIETPVVGRHGGEFYTFGDYSANLFEHIKYNGDPPARSLFDMAAVAIVKNPEWAMATSMPCPVMEDKNWVEQPENPRTILLWEHFDRDAIIGDFLTTLREPVLVK